jgi:membrane-bound metal-dependent hydrolase YbcI (DUF457 family)
MPKVRVTGAAARNSAVPAGWRPPCRTLWRKPAIMITLNHGFSGYVVGQVVMPILRSRAPVGPGALSAAFFLGAMAPDLDILTRVVAGRAAYFSTAWYGHRGASHSLLGTLLLSLVVAAAISGWQAARRGRTVPGPTPAAGRRGRLAGYAWLAGCAWAGGLLHVVGDLFTPARPMPVLWPLPERVGALGHIGWFSPYLLWLFLATIALGWAGRWLLSRVAGPRPWTGVAVWALYALASYRWVQYMIVSRYESPEQWQAYQEALLPEIMVAPLTAAVRAAWLWLTR